MNYLTLVEEVTAMHKAVAAGTQGAVVSLDVVGFFYLLRKVVVRTTRCPGLGGQRASGSSSMIAASSRLALVERNALVEPAGTVLAAIIQIVGDRLAGYLAQSYPHPAGLCLDTHKAPKLVQFQHIAVLPEHQCILQCRGDFSFFPRPPGQGVVRHVKEPRGGPDRQALTYMSRSDALVRRIVDGLQT